MMDEWHGYILLEKPERMPMNAWENALQGLLAPLNGSPKDRQPAKRLHIRISLDGTKVIVEAVFPPGRIEAIRQNQASVFKWAFGSTWMESGNEVRTYLAANIDEWEEQI